MIHCCRLHNQYVRKKYHTQLFLLLVLENKGFCINAGIWTAGFGDQGVDSCYRQSFNRTNTDDDVAQTFQTRGPKHAANLRPQTHFKLGASNTLQTRGPKHAANLRPQTRYKPKASDTLHTRDLKQATNVRPQTHYKPGFSNTLQTRGVKNAANQEPQTCGPWAT